MISTWHLLWIVPLAGSLGFVTAALLKANGNDSRPTTNDNRSTTEKK